VSWITGGDPVVVMQGQSYDWKARFCVESHGELMISSACWTSTATLGAFFGSSCESLGDLQDGPIYSIQRHIVVPPDLKPGLYTGNIAIIGTRTHLENDKGKPPTTPGRGVVAKTLPLQIHVVEAH
jgi:hypothetical protein